MTVHGSTSRLIAFYLPQYHPTPENNEWWGEGFTDWLNVVQARPLFPGHQQPHLPADLGFYDLRLAATRQAQADLARAYGIYGFCYYHYWFGGKRLLAQPLDDVLASGTPDFPFCVCWANENWTRSWDGQEQHVLVNTVSTADDDRAHIRWLVEVFRDPRYIRVEGKPLVLIYRVSKLLDPRRTIAVWREEARRLALGEIFIASVESLMDDRVDPVVNGFDASVEFQPDWLSLGLPLRVTPEGAKVFSYAEVVDRMLRKPAPGHRRFPCVATAWDNTARRRRDATVLDGASPELYEVWLRQVLVKTTASGTRSPLVFVNAWNEWAEGAYLEPCQRWGRAYLEATRRAIQMSDAIPWASAPADSHQQPALGAPQTVPAPTPPEATTVARGSDQSAIANLERVLAELWRRDDELSGRTTALERDLARSRADASAAESEVENLKEALRVAKSQMGVMRASFSWRVTAPIRSIVRLLGGMTTDTSLGHRM